MTQRYSAVKIFGYNGKELDTGQVIELAGLRNDARLVSLGYFNEVPKGTKTLRCGECGAQFLEERYRERHGDFRHPVTELDQALAPAEIRAAKRQSILEVAPA